MIKNKKNQIKYGILALLFSFLTFGIFKNVEASPQGSSAQIMLEPAEIRVQNNGNQTSFLSRIGSGIMSILTAPVRFFRWLFEGRAATPVVVEESNSEEEDEEEEYREEEEKTEKGRSNTNDINPLPELASQPAIVEIEEEEMDEEEKKEEDTTEIPTISATGNSAILDTSSTSVSTTIHDVQEMMKNRNTEEEIEKEEEDKD